MKKSQKTISKIAMCSYVGVFGLFNRWSIQLLARWCVPTLICWFVRTLGCWCVQSLVCSIVGAYVCSYVDVLMCSRVGCFASWSKCDIFTLRHLNRKTNLSTLSLTLISIDHIQLFIVPNKDK